MALVVEDGSITNGANTYLSDQDFQDYASQRGLTVPGTPAERESLLIQAKDYIESYRARFIGRKRDTAQSLQWPRVDAYIDGQSFPEDAIPQELKNAQAEAALEANNQDLMPTGDGREVIQEAVEGAVSVQYSQQNNTNPQPQLTKVHAWLNPLLSSSGGLKVSRG